MSALEDSDDSFALILQNSFDLKQKQPEKVSPAKNIPDYESQIREGMKQMNVVRSGMGSNDNPLNNTKEYYPKVNNASRGNVTSSQMYSFAKPLIVDEQKPKDSFAQF